VSDPALPELIHTSCRSESSNISLVVLDSSTTKSIAQPAAVQRQIHLLQGLLHELERQRSHAATETAPTATVQDSSTSYRESAFNYRDSWRDCSFSHRDSSTTAGEELYQLEG
jgi:hypothetical protein